MIYYFGIGILLWLSASIFGKNTREMLRKNYSSKDPFNIIATTFGQLIFIVGWPLVLGVALYIATTTKISELVIRKRIRDLEDIVKKTRM